MNKAKQSHKKSDVIEEIETLAGQQAKEVRIEYRHLKKFQQENSLLFGILILGVTALVIINTLFWTHHTNRNAQAELKQNTTVASLSANTSLQTAQNFAVAAQVSNVGSNSSADPAFPLEPGKTRLTMDIAITNQTQETQQLTPVSQFYIRSADGDYSMIYPSTSMTNPLASQDIAPGATAKGQISFSVTQSQTRPLLYIDTMWGNSTPLVVDVLH